MNTTTQRDMPIPGVSSSLNAAIALKQLSTSVEDLVGKAISKGATPRDAAKMVSGRLPTSPFALRRPNSLCCANAALPWMYLGIHQSVTYFPGLVTTSGERMFNACWKE